MRGNERTPAGSGVRARAGSPPPPSRAQTRSDSHLPRACAGPVYADVTWGAGGSTSDLTLELCIKLKEEYGMEPNMHLTW